MLRFFADAIQAMFFMVVLTTAIFCWSASELVRLHTSTADIVTAYLTALTIAVPPGLVACLSVATSIAIGRLDYLHNISVSETTRVNYAGTVSFASFDKTGTLTDENIDFHGMEIGQTKIPGLPSDCAADDLCREIMATCHALSIVNGVAAGDPLEVELLRASGWKLSSDHREMRASPSDKTIAGDCFVLRHFEFTPEKLRAGSIVRRGGDASRASSSLMYYVKGSPEMIMALSDPATLPKDIVRSLTVLSKRGYRVLAIAFRPLTHIPPTKVNTVSQTELEGDNKLIFLGLVYFSSKLKPASKEMFEHFDRANIKASMITGDHIYTAIAVATECSLLAPESRRKLYIIDEDPVSLDPKIVDSDKEEEPCAISFAQLFAAASAPVTKDGKVTQIAITGKGLNALKAKNPGCVEPVLRNCRVFARMKPADKKMIVVSLQEFLDPHGQPVKVVYCGDGANDMAALSAATVGVSLCDAETTVAASIVSRKQVPTAVVEVLKEGRCSLITAYCLVSFNIMYAIIQLFMTCYLNNVGLKFGDNMYIVQDLFYSLFLGLSIAYTGPQDELDVKLPPQRYLSFGLLLKLFGQLTIFPLFQYFGLLLLRTQSWYSAYETDEPLTGSISYESTTVNAIALAQLMIASVVVTIGKPFRKPWYTSQMHLACFAGQSIWLLYILFGKYDSFLRMMSNLPVKTDFAIIILCLIACNCVVSGLWTKFADRFI